LVKEMNVLNLCHNFKRIVRFMPPRIITIVKFILGKDGKSTYLQSLFHLYI